jgi:hypothetical protein
MRQVTKKMKKSQPTSEKSKTLFVTRKGGGGGGREKKAKLFCDRNKMEQEQNKTLSFFFKFLELVTARKKGR